MNEFKQSYARDYILIDGVYYFRCFNCNEMMMRHQVFAHGVDYKIMNNYLFVERKDGKYLIFYLFGDNGVLHGPICTEYHDPEFNQAVEYCIDGKSWSRWNPFAELSL